MHRTNLLKKAGVAASLFICILCGIAGLSLILFEKPLMRAEHSFALSRALVAAAQDQSLPAEARLALLNKARAAKFKAIVQTPHDPTLWIDLGKFALALSPQAGREEARRALEIAVKLDPRLKPLLERGEL